MSFSKISSTAYDVVRPFPSSPMQVLRACLRGPCVSVLLTGNPAKIDTGLSLRLPPGVVLTMGTPPSLLAKGVHVLSTLQCGGPGEVVVWLVGDGARIGDGEVVAEVVFSKVLTAPTLDGPASSGIFGHHPVSDNPFASSNFAPLGRRDGNPFGPTAFGAPISQAALTSFNTTRTSPFAPTAGDPFADDRPRTVPASLREPAESELLNAATIRQHTGNNIACARPTPLSGATIRQHTGGESVFARTFSPPMRPIAPRGTYDFDGDVDTDGKMVFGRPPVPQPTRLSGGARADERPEDLV